MMNDEQKGREEKKSRHLLYNGACFTCQPTGYARSLRVVGNGIASFKRKLFFFLDVIKVEGGFLSMGCC